MFFGSKSIASICYGYSFMGLTHSMARARSRSRSCSLIHLPARSFVRHRLSLSLSLAPSHTFTQFILVARKYIALNAYLSEFACVIFCVAVGISLLRVALYFLSNRFWVSFIRWDIAHTSIYAHICKHRVCTVCACVRIFFYVLVFVFRKRHLHIRQQMGYLNAYSLVNSSYFSGPFAPNSLSAHFVCTNDRETKAFDLRNMRWILSNEHKTILWIWSK